MKNEYDVLIIGGGYSALVLANRLKETIKVAVLERLDRVGKKILSTGNGRANISNKNISVANYHGSDAKFCSYAISKYDLDSLYDFFESKGMLLTTVGDKVFPQSLQANSVLDTLRLSLKSNVSVITGERATEIRKNKKCFEVVTEKSVYRAVNVVCAFGGASQKQFGTDGTSYALAQAFGHGVTELKPSLVQLKCDNKEIRSLQGVKVNASVTLVSNGVRVKEQTGDLLFVNGGLSGNTVFYLSAYLGDKDNLFDVDFVPNYDDNRLIQGLICRKEALCDCSCDEFLSGVVNKAVGKVIMKSVTDKKNVKQINDDDVAKIARLLKKFTFNITGRFGFDNSQVTHGGIKTDTVDCETMQSELVEGLYFIGEALDVDGDCGGYNMHWAYASACAVGKVLNDKSF
ncbi:MAG: aminoacetone oxidase family FAD-binding enzyme [Christensenellaceae bacterium]